MPLLEFHFNKVAGLKACNFIEKDSNTGVSCEIFENFKNNNFEEHLSASNCSCVPQKNKSIACIRKADVGQ